jgi:DNA-binding PadR family transcriptional regulator
LQLLALIVTERNGREIAKLFQKETGQRLPYGTVYATLKLMEEAGWVSAKDELRDRDRRWVRLFRITGAGTKALNRGREFYRDLADFNPTEEEPANVVVEGGRA